MSKKFNLRELQQEYLDLVKATHAVNFGLSVNEFNEKYGDRKDVIVSADGFILIEYDKAIFCYQLANGTINVAEAKRLWSILINC